MSWQEYFPYVIIPNLTDRQDRFERMKEMLTTYGIAGTFLEATRHTDGKLGLVITMKEIFEMCLKNGFERVLILEDDCDIIVPVGEFHSVMDSCVEDLKDTNWDLFYLGLQHPNNFALWRTPNLLHVSHGYSTHSVAYSKRAMQFICGAHITIPVDNYLVENFQKHNTSFCSYPILTTQAPGYSDIYNDYIDWRSVIKPTYDKFVRDILPQRFKQNI